MKDFTLHIPTKLIFGKDSMNCIADESQQFGKKILLTYGGGSIKKNGVYEKVIEELKDFEIKEFGGIEPNPRVETIRRAIEISKEFQPDLILAVGGGSTIDGSKLISAATYYDGDAWDILIKDNLKLTKFIPLGTVLTLPATGTEMNGNSVITNWKENLKLAFSFQEVFPKFSILDPQNTFSLPKNQTAYGIVDAYAHVLEQYMHTTSSTPIQDRFSEGIMKTLIEYGLKAIKNPEDYDVRANIMFSATMALNTLIGMGVDQDWATHDIEHEISAFYDIPHGAGLAILFPRWLEVVAKDQKFEKLVQYGKRLFELDNDSSLSDEEIADVAIQKTFDFFESLGVKMCLKDWNITDEHFETMTDRLVKAKVGEFALNKDQIGSILKKSL